MQQLEEHPNKKRSADQLRIVSLIASSTETICALGFGDELVGRSHECDYPKSVLKLPPCSEPKFKIEGSSKEIDQRVKEVLQNALSVYKVDVEKLQELAPSLIVTQDHCVVCAVSLRDVEEAACRLLASQPKIVALSPNTLEDIYLGFREIGEALGGEGAEKSSERLVSEMKKGISEIRKKTQKLHSKPKTAFLEWIDPIWTSGSWIPEIIDYAGGLDVLGKKGQHSRSIDFNELRKADPSIIIIGPCGYDIPKAMKELAPLVNHPEWEKLDAVQNSQVYITNGNYYFNRPGPRLLDSLKIAAEILHPQHFSFGYETEGWIRWKDRF